MQEEELIQHILNMESQLSGLTLGYFRSLTLQLAERNSLIPQFNIDKKKWAGKTSLCKILEIYPNVKLRTFEPTSLARPMGFNRPVIQQLFMQHVQKVRFYCTRREVHTKNRKSFIRVS